LQSIRSLSVRQYRAANQSRDPSLYRFVGANADLVRGSSPRPSSASIASADGIDYMESSNAQDQHQTGSLELNYDTNAALTRIQPKVAR